MTSPVVGFRNLAQSCFVNAGIQVFFGVRPLAASFAEGVTEAEAALSRLLARVAEARQPLVPTELTRTYYRGRQEDLAEFALNILSECAGCHGLLCGQEVPRLHCRHCPYGRPLRAENFHSVQLSILDIHSVQDALNAYLVRATVQEDVGDWCCLSADCLDGGRAQDAPLHVSRVEHWPRVLALTLKRWTRPGEVLAAPRLLQQALEGRRECIRFVLFGHPRWPSS